MSPRIVVSGSQPHGERAVSEADLYRPTDINMAVSAVVGEVLRRPGWVLRFGGEPAITSQVLMIAQELGDLRMGSIELVQSRIFDNSYTDDMRSLAAAENVRTTFTESGPDVEASLVIMRQVLFSHRIDAVFFVGGMSGVAKEYGMLRDRHPTVWAFAFSEPGGAAASLGTHRDDQYLEIIDGAAYGVDVRRILDRELSRDSRR